MLLQQQKSMGWPSTSDTGSKFHLAILRLFDSREDHKRLELDGAMMFSISILYEQSLDPLEKAANRLQDCLCTSMYRIGIIMIRLNATHRGQLGPTVGSGIKQLPSPKPAHPPPSPPSDHQTTYQTRCLAVLLVINMNLRACSWTWRTTYAFVSNLLKLEN